jgi:hypothetical protein
MSGCIVISAFFNANFMRASAHRHILVKEYFIGKCVFFYMLYHQMCYFHEHECNLSGNPQTDYKNVSCIIPTPGFVGKQSYVGGTPNYIHAIADPLEVL